MIELLPKGWLGISPAMPHSPVSYAKLNGDRFSISRLSPIWSRNGCQDGSGTFKGEIKAILGEPFNVTSNGFYISGVIAFDVRGRWSHWSIDD